jgi:hypothetical protein
VVQPGQNGFLANTSEEWQLALRQLIDRPDLRRRMGDKGRALVRRSYSVRVGWSSYVGILTAALRENPVLRNLILIFLSLGMTCQLQAEPHHMRLGVDADNWSGQIQNASFEASLRRLELDFISWHLQPEEESSPQRINQIVKFCRKNHWAYLFNNEVANYRREDAQFRHQDAAFRYDIAEQTLQQLKDDPLFLGVVYDEADLMQTMNGVVFGKGGPIEPYFVDTRQMTASQAFLAVSEKVAEITRRYQSYGKRLIFEMVFPDNPFPYARAGALLAPKLMKENFNDLMYAVYRGAALEYHSKELWACVDLWFLDKFPFSGKLQPGGHTPEQLLETLKYAASSGFDYAYIEQYKGLLDDAFALTAFGEKVIEFNRWHESHRDGNWRTAPIDVYVKRFPDGYWGQKYSPFVPDHPYGSWLPNPYRTRDHAWLKKLNELSHGNIPADADNWNASKSPEFSNRPYQTMAGLPAMVVFDQFGVIPAETKATVLDFTSTIH